MRNWYQKNLWFCVFLVIFAFSTSELFSEVYLKGPGKGDDGGGSASPLPLNEHRLWTEPVVVNGVKLDIEMSLLDEPFSICLPRMKKLYPDALMSATPKSLLFEIMENGVKRRIYIVGIGGIYPSIQFAVDMPQNIPEKFTWPRELPLPAGAVPQRYVALPDRDSVLGSFRSVSDPKTTIDMLSSLLESDGWVTAGSGKNDTPDSPGGIFLKTNPLRIMNIAAEKNKSGDCFATVYMHTAKK